MLQLNPSKLEATMAGAVLVVVFVVASYARFKVSERRFLRRNVAGLQLFHSYGHALVVQFVEGLVYSIASIAQALAIAAAVIGGGWFALH